MMIRMIPRVGVVALPFIALTLLANLVTCSAGNHYQPQDGDIIFHVSRSAQSQAIQLATGSPYSHMGIIYLNNEMPYVFEAVQPVKSTPLHEWIARGENGHYVVKRLRDAESRLTPDVIKKMQSVGERFIGKNYDLYFEWSDERIYCSELVWKIFKEGAGIEVGMMQTMADFDLSHAVVQNKIRERFADKIPLAEPVITPVAIFDTPILITVFEN